MELKSWVRQLGQQLRTEHPERDQSRRSHPPVMPDQAFERVEVE